ncbi:hypothetical protein GCM10010363_43570 [Streptomyces omiyaensis]|nr:hypothetical protein GCM10010363_43570 [Streptomyces omiyaensis]
MRDVFVGREPSHRPDAPPGMVTTGPLLGPVPGVVISRAGFAVFAVFAARGAVPSGRGRATTPRRAGTTVLDPLASGVVDACPFGPWWGPGTALTAYALRKGVVVEYRTGRRRPHRPHGTSHDPAYRPPPWPRRAAGAEQWAALLLTVAVLPVLTFASALDGQAWTSIVTCRVTGGTRTSDARPIELSREGDGVAGRHPDAGEISDGLGGAAAESRFVREPWRRTGWSRGLPPRSRLSGPAGRTPAGRAPAASFRPAAAARPARGRRRRPPAGSR